MKPVSPWRSTSGTEPWLKAITGVPQASASIMTSPNGSGQSMGNSKARAFPSNSFFLPLVDLAHELNQGMPQQGLDPGFEILPVGLVHLGGHLEGQAGSKGDFNGPVGALLGGHPPQEGQIIAGLGAEAVQIFGQAVLDGAQPIGAADRHTLVIRNGHHGQLAEVVEDGPQIPQVQAAMEGGDMGHRRAAEHREVQIIRVEMDDVELGGHFRHPVEHQ